ELRAAKLGAEMREPRAGATAPARARRGKVALDGAEPRGRLLDACRDFGEVLAQRRARMLGAFGHARGQALGVAGEPGGDDALARDAPDVPGKAEALEAADQPLARVPRRPRHAVSVVRGEAMVEVVVALTEREQGRH